MGRAAAPQNEVLTTGPYQSGATPSGAARPASGVAQSGVARPGQPCGAARPGQPVRGSPSGVDMTSRGQIRSS